MHNRHLHRPPRACPALRRASQTAVIESAEHTDENVMHSRGDAGRRAGEALDVSDPRRKTVQGMWELLAKYR